MFALLVDFSDFLRSARTYCIYKAQGIHGVSDQQDQIGGISQRRLFKSLFLDELTNCAGYSSFPPLSERPCSIDKIFKKKLETFVKCSSFVWPISLILQTGVSQAELSRFKWHFEQGGL
jgi:hypothetical protein